METAKRLRVGNPRYSRFGNLRYGAVVTLNKYMRESVGRRPGEGVVHGPNACAKAPRSYTREAAPDDTEVIADKTPNPKRQIQRSPKTQTPSQPPLRSR